MKRQPAVAGSFYPADAHHLHTMVEQYLKDARSLSKVPKAIIAPHAGFIYSGPIAASAYARLTRARNIIKQVILIGPSHQIHFSGLAASNASHFSTPLGDIPLNQSSIAAIIDLPYIDYFEEAHTFEHSLEVHLPFLQETLDKFSIVPLVVGNATPEHVSTVLDKLWGGPETLIVISSDLSHYHDYQTAQYLDQETSEKIEQLNYELLAANSACGAIPISGLLAFAKARSLAINTIDLRNSGDTEGNKDRVVGYGAYVIE
jgi:AmmeMemoRadiSam system protein B